eukprot:Rhum_TRINITY_DN13518_c0_g2::Rhum_TRINITY_DN13518_c0_g2_i1::g.60977::m.60977
MLTSPRTSVCAVLSAHPLCIHPPSPFDKTAYVHKQFFLWGAEDPNDTRCLIPKPVLECPTLNKEILNHQRKKNIYKTKGYNREPTSQPAVVFFCSGEQTPPDYSRCLNAGGPLSSQHDALAHLVDDSSSMPVSPFSCCPQTYRQKEPLPCWKQRGAAAAQCDVRHSAAAYIPILPMLRRSLASCCTIQHQNKYIPHTPHPRIPTHSIEALISCIRLAANSFVRLACQPKVQHNVMCLNRIPVSPMTSIVAVIPSPSPDPHPILTRPWLAEYIKSGGIGLFARTDFSCLCVFRFSLVLANPHPTMFALVLSSHFPQPTQRTRNTLLRSCLQRARVSVKACSPHA